MTSVDEGFVKNLLEHMGDWFGDEEQFQLARLGRTEDRRCGFRAPGDREDPRATRTAEAATAQIDRA